MREMISVNPGQLAFCTAVAIAVCGCSNSVGPDRSGSGLIPLAVGNSWTYDMTRYDTTGSVIGTDSATVSVLRDTSIFGRHFYLYDVFWLTNTDSGLIDYNGVTKTGIAWVYYYQFPTNTGASYFSVGGGTYVESTDTVITVPAGSFHCIHYQIYSQDINFKPILFQDDYVCPSLGVVKHTYYVYPVTSWGRSVTLQLRTYEVNP